MDEIKGPREILNIYSRGRAPRALRFFQFATMMIGKAFRVVKK